MLLVTPSVPDCCWLCCFPLLSRAHAVTLFVLVFLKKLARDPQKPGIVLYSAADSVPQGGTGGGVVGAGMEAGEGDLDMAPVDLEQAMGSFSPEWANDTVSSKTSQYCLAAETPPIYRYELLMRLDGDDKG